MLTAIAHAVAALCGGSAAVLDPAGAVVASAGDPPSCRPPASPRPPRGVVERADADARPLVVAAGVHGPLGYSGAVVAYASGAPLAPRSASAVEDAARVASRYLCPYATSGAPPSHDGRYAVAAFAAPVPADDLAARVRAAWSRRPEAVSVTAANGVVFAVTADVANAACAALEVAREAERVLRVPVHAGVTPGFDSDVGLADARDVATQVLRAVRGRDGDRVACLDDVRADALLVALRDAAAERGDLLPGVVTPLAEHDRRHGTDYVATLRAYLDSFGDVVAAAQCVRVHPRTFRYRMTRLRELSGIRLDDAEERLAAQLELRLVQS